MNVDLIFDTMNRHGVRYLLIGGMNFMLRHEPISTYDVDLWIEDTVENRRSCEAALSELNAEWGQSDETWGPVRALSSGWLDQQGMFCLTSPHGSLDIFHSVEGLGPWEVSWNCGIESRLTTGTTYRALSDEDMLLCQLALPAGQQKASRIETLRSVIARKGNVS